MINTLDASTINLFGIDRESPYEARRKAGNQFSRAFARGLRHSLWNKLRGHNNQLQTLHQAALDAKRVPPASNGIISISLDKIVGSIGRSNEFDVDFYPRQTYTRDRWISVAAARNRGIALPPIELIQRGDEYFVSDGNHRVSVAKASGQKEIEAQVMYKLVS